MYFRENHLLTTHDPTRLDITSLYYPFPRFEMKIVIIGCGIAGLSSYLLLKKHLPNPSPPAQPHSITIYETYDTSKARYTKEIEQSGRRRDTDTVGIGGGLGVMCNGLKVLNRIDEQLLEKIARSGHPINTSKLSNSRGWTLMEAKAKTTADMPLGGIMIFRQALWLSLRELVPDEVIVRGKVVQVLARAGEQKNLIKFADGSPDEEADLVIGADGLRSTTRNTIFSDDPDKVVYPAHYEYGHLSWQSPVNNKLMAITGASWALEG